MLSAALGAALMASALLSSHPTSAGACTTRVVAAGMCGAEGAGGTLVITDSREEPQVDAPSNATSGSRPPAGDSAADPKVTSPVCVFDPIFLLPQCTFVAFEAHPPRPGTEAMPSLSVSDLAGFAPATVRVAAEPDNVGVAGLPTNFLSAAQVHTRTGELFGTPVRVRFTPVGYDYEYGDGSSATLTAAGRSWRDLGQAQFTATRTSHVYSHRGTYSAEVDIRYTAEVDLGTGWLDVIGELRSEGEPQEITVYEARTALVARTCGENPAAPGC